MNLDAIKSLPKNEPKEVRFSPYVSNSGTCMAISGKDFAVLAGDRRMSYGYSIASRDVGKCSTLTSRCVLGSGGMQADRTTLHRTLKAKLALYTHEHDKEMDVISVAQLLSTTLYYKRFFPYYAFNVLAGVDKNGEGAVYGYDSIGSFERIPYGVTGSGSALITSILDNQVEFFTQPQNKRELDVEATVALVKDSFTVCGERDIYTGDMVDIYVITKDGIKHELFELKRD